MPPPSSLSSPSRRMRCMCSTNLLIHCAFYLTILSTANLVAAQTTSTSPETATATATIATGTNGYKYIGCYNETTTLSGTSSGTRALYGGINEVLPGEMTVERCLEFCKGGMEKGYRFAGLEYSRECWCATQLFSLSSKVADSDCELACDGDKSQICGGDLRISVYDLNGVVNSVAAAGQSAGLVLGLVLVVAGGVIAHLL